MTGKMNPRTWSPRALGTAAAAATGGVLLLSRLLPSAEGGPVLCLFRAVTTLPCPSCGMTRAFVALGHGDMRSALHFNLASPAVFAAAGILFILSLVQAAQNHPEMAGPLIEMLTNRGGNRDEVIKHLRDLCNVKHPLVRAAAIVSLCQTAPKQSSEELLGAIDAEE